MATTNNLFNKLESYRTALVPIAIQLSQTRMNPDTESNQTVQVENTEKIKLNVHTITANELREAESIMDDAVPPKIFTEEPASTGHGTAKVMTGYDFEDPKYVADRERLLPRRHAHVVLAGCPELRESTPGESIPEKVDAMLSRLPSVVIEMIAYQIENLGISGVIGQEEVDRFFTDASKTEASTKRSNTTKARQPRTKKKS